MLRKFVGVGFHSSPGEGAVSSGIAVKMIHETHKKHENIKQKNLCNLRNLWFLLFHRLHPFGLLTFPFGSFTRPF
jgi:hypothetical protein